MTGILGIFLALTLGVTASAPADDIVGRWRIQGDAGTCSASTSLGDGELLMIFARAPGGENNGGLMFGSPGNWQIVDGPAAINLAGEGSTTGKHDATGYAELSGYFLPFGSTEEMDNYPDTWQLLAIKDDHVLIDKPVTEFKAAVATLESCANKPN
jgi:hypothetical protein